MAATTKVDKRSKAYRDANKKDRVHVPKVIAERLTKSLQADVSITGQLKELQAMASKLNVRITQLEQKIG